MTVMPEEAAPESGGDEKAWLSRARKAYWEGDKQRAMGLYREGLKQYPESASMLGELGNIAFEAGRLDEALGYLRKAEHSLRAAGETRRADNLKTIIGMIEREIAEKGAKAR
jgi:tetratricopeptide (TPR) repeat protein